MEAGEMDKRTFLALEDNSRWPWYDWKDFILRGY